MRKYRIAVLTLICVIVAHECSCEAYYVCSATATVHEAIMKESSLSLISICSLTLAI